MPQTFHWVMDRVMRGLYFFMVYVDDILVISSPKQTKQTIFGMYLATLRNTASNCTQRSVFLVSLPWISWGTG